MKQTRPLPVPPEGQPPPSPPDPSLSLRRRLHQLLEAGEDEAGARLIRNLQRLSRQGQPV